MGSVPSNKLEFAAYVRDAIQRLQRGYRVDLIGENELLVNGRRLDLINLQRMVLHEPERRDEIIADYIERLFGEEIDAQLVVAGSWAAARDRIMPRLHPVSIFEHVDRRQLVHVPFVGNLVIAMVLDFPQMTVTLKTADLQRWGGSTSTPLRLRLERIWTPMLRIWR